MHFGTVQCVLSFLPPAGMDYTPSGVQTVLFPAGTGNGAVKNASLTILNDSIVEGSETVVLMGSLTPGGEDFLCTRTRQCYSPHMG